MSGGPDPKVSRGGGVADPARPQADSFSELLEEVYLRVISHVPLHARGDVARDFLRLEQAYLADASRAPARPVDHQRKSQACVNGDRRSRLADLHAIAAGSLPANPDELEQHLWVLSDPKFGRGEDIELLRKLEPVTRAISSELEQLRQETEQAVIWNASADAKPWLSALDSAGPKEQLWLVTTLITRTIEAQGGEARGATGGTVQTSAPALITPEQQDALLRLLSVGDDEAVRTEVMYALGEAGGGEAVRTLVRILARGDETPRMRSRAAVALGRIGGPAAVAALIQAAETDPDRLAVRCAVNGLRGLLPTGDALATAPIRQLLEKIVDSAETAPVTREIARQGLEAYAASQS